MVDWGIERHSPFHSKGSLLSDEEDENERDIYVTIKKDPTKSIGIVILDTSTSIYPCVLNITPDSPASKAHPALLPGDQIVEIDGIETTRLKHMQIIALFHKASDMLTMTVRREEKQTSLSQVEWLKKPAISDLAFSAPPLKILDEKLGHSLKLSSFTTFKNSDINQKRISNIRRSIHQGRSLSASSLLTTSSCELKRDLIEVPESYHSLDRKLRNLLVASPEPFPQGKLIRDAIEHKNNRTLRHPHQRRHFDSQESISTVSSCSSGEQTNGSHSSRENNFFHNSPVKERIINSPLLTRNHNNTNILRNSLRMNNKASKSVLKCRTNDNTFLRTVWLSDAKKLGIRLGGGVTSPYGATNIAVTEVKRTAAEDTFRVNDQILQIGGVSTSGMDVYEANALIKKLKGSYVEFKIFRLLARY